MATWLVVVQLFTASGQLLDEVVLNVGPRSIAHDRGAPNLVALFNLIARQTAIDTGYYLQLRTAGQPTN